MPCGPLQAMWLVAFATSHPLYGALSMMSQGIALGNWKGNGTLSLVGEKKAASRKDIVMEDGKQVVKSKLNPYRYPDITVRKGIPVRWEIEADESSLNGCNYKMIFRDLGFMYTMNFGTNVIEFTPEKSGRIDYTCWMGMVRGSITVED